MDLVLIAVIALSLIYKFWIRQRQKRNIKSDMKFDFLSLKKRINDVTSKIPYEQIPSLTGSNGRRVCAFL